MSKAIDLENGLPAIKTWIEGKFVEKESGKGLSTNDYTTDEKTKLAGIEAGAEVNVQPDWNQTTTTADDYIKNKPTIDTALSSSSTNAVQNKVINTALSNKVDKVSGKGLSTNDYTTAEKDKLAGIEAGAQVNIVTDMELSGEGMSEVIIFDSSEHVATNYHAPTQSAMIAMGNQLLSNVVSDVKVDGTSVVTTVTDDDTTYKVANIDLTGKVDKETGKGLSTNDYTTAEKNKLANIAAGAQVNVLEGVQVNGTDLSITSKKVNVPKATNSTYGAIILSDSTSSTTAAASGGTAATPKAVKDALDAAKSYADGIGGDIPSAADAAPLMDGTAAVGTSTDYAREDHVHPTDTSRAANTDFTAPTNSAAGTHGLVPAPPQSGQKDVLTASGFRVLSGEIYIDAQSSPSGGIRASKISSSNLTLVFNRGGTSTYGMTLLSDVIDGTAAAASGGTAATPKAVKDALDAAKSYADTKVTGLYSYKGSVATYANLPASPATGDVYNVEAAYQDHPAGTNWAWTGTAWDALGGSFTITYATAAEVTAVLEA